MKNILKLELEKSTADKFIDMLSTKKGVENIQKINLEGASGVYFETKEKITEILSPIIPMICIVDDDKYVKSFCTYKMFDKDTDVIKWFDWDSITGLVTTSDIFSKAIKSKNNLAGRFIEENLSLYGKDKDKILNILSEQYADECIA